MEHLLRSRHISLPSESGNLVKGLVLFLQNSRREKDKNRKICFTSRKQPNVFIRIFFRRVRSQRAGTKILHAPNYETKVPRKEGLERLLNPLRGVAPASIPNPELHSSLSPVASTHLPAFVSMTLLSFHLHP